MRNWIHIGLALVSMVAALSVGVAYRAAQKDAVKLREELQASQKALTDAASRQETRDADLKRALAALQVQKTTVRTPTEVIRALPTVLPLPTPLTVDPAAAGPSVLKQAQGPGEKPAGASPLPIHLPAEDLKPLYDFAVDCKACKEQLAAAQSDLQDEKSKTVAITKERDDALRVARGGSVLRRVVRGAKWFAVGAALGAAAARIAR